MATFHFQEIKYYNTLNKPGIYLLKFPNGMNYIGSTKHIHDRLKQHFLNFFKYSNLDAKWYIDAKTVLYEYAKNEELSFYEGIWRGVKIYIQYTSNPYEAQQLERQALYSIKENNFQNKYYNTRYN